VLLLDFQKGCNVCTSKDLKNILLRGGTIKLVLISDSNEAILSNELDAVTPLDNGAVRLRWHMGTIAHAANLNKAVLLGGRNNILTICDIRPISSYFTQGQDLCLEIIYNY
jgi:hypothetical protein